VQDGCIGEQKLIHENISPGGLNIQEISWYVDDVFVGSGSGLNYSYLVPGLHKIYAVVETNLGCRDTGTVKDFSVFEKPIAAFDIEILNPTSSGVPVKFLDQSTGATKWWWNPEGKVKIPGQSFSHVFARLGNTTSWLIVENDFGCRDSISRDFLITSSENHFFPNAFTPNADGRNDVFKPFDLSAIIQYNMMVYDRWGAKIFETNDPNVGWDGKFRGEDVPDGGYVYSVNLVYLTGKRFAGGGTVIIFR
jgi:gliding motility-associated-like protein